MINKTEEIWEKFCCKLKSFILKRISDPAAAEDILQDVFLKIHSKIDTLRDETKLKSWIYQIAKNTITDYYRKQKREITGLDVLTETEDEEIKKGKLRSRNTIPDMETDENIIEQEIASGLKEMVQTLPEKYAQALFLVEFEGLSQTELAEKLRISVSGAKSRIQRGRKMLKDALMRCCHFEFDKYGTIIGAHPVSCCCCN